MFTAKSKAYFIGFVIMGLLAVCGTLFLLFFADTFGVWFMTLFAAYGFVRFGIDICRWIAKDVPTEAKPTRREKKLDAAEREASKKSFLAMVGETEE